MEYTKGEWKIEGHTVVSDALQCGIWLYKIADVTAHARVETIANANLIAAAPKLDRYREYVDAKIDIGEVPLRFDEFEQEGFMQIAKAEGK